MVPFFAMIFLQNLLPVLLDGHKDRSEHRSLQPAVGLLPGLIPYQLAASLAESKGRAGKALFPMFVGMIPRQDVLQVSEVPVMDGTYLPGGVVAGIQVPLKVQVQHREPVPAGRRIPVPFPFPRKVEVFQRVEQLPDIGFFRVPFRRDPFPEALQEPEGHVFHLPFHPAVVNFQEAFPRKARVHDFVQVHRNLVAMDGTVLFRNLLEGLEDFPGIGPGGKYPGQAEMLQSQDPFPGFRGRKHIMASCLQDVGSIPGDGNGEVMGMKKTDHFVRQCPTIGDNAKGYGNFPSFDFFHHFLDGSKVQKRLSAVELQVESPGILLGHFSQEVVDFRIHFPAQRFMHQWMLEAVGTVHIAGIPQHEEYRVDVSS